MSMEKTDKESLQSIIQYIIFRCHYNIIEN